MTALHLFIVARSLQSNRGSQAQREKVVADSQEAGVVTFSPGPPEPSWRLLMALMLNLPAVYAGVPVALLLRCGGDIGLLSCSIPFVPPLWYANRTQARCQDWSISSDATCAFLEVAHSAGHIPVLCGLYGDCVRPCAPQFTSPNSEARLWAVYSLYMVCNLPSLHVLVR